MTHQHDHVEEVHETGHGHSAWYGGGIGLGGIIALILLIVLLVIVF